MEIEKIYEMIIASTLLKTLKFTEKKTLKLKKTAKKISIIKLVIFVK